MEQKDNLVGFWKERIGITKEEAEAFLNVRREDFIAPELKEHAYEDRPLPILRGKTISQPTTVMIMTHALELKPGENVFEIGTGSGYQTAIISSLVGEKGKVITTEVIPELVTYSRKTLSEYNNVQILEEDGSKGYPANAPYDKIIITAACSEFPPELLDELKVGGIIVGPVGDDKEQSLLKGTKKDEDKLDFESIGPFLFSPLYGKYGFEI